MGSFGLWTDVSSSSSAWLVEASVRSIGSFFTSGEMDTSSTCTVSRGRIVVLIHTVKLPLDLALCPTLSTLLIGAMVCCNLTSEETAIGSICTNVVPVRLVVLFLTSILNFNHAACPAVCPALSCTTRDLFAMMRINRTTTARQIIAMLTTIKGTLSFNGTPSTS
jgi:hypothetical protein